MLVYAVVCADAPSKMRLVQVLWRMLEQAEWKEDTTFDPDFLAKVISLISAPYCQNRERRPLGIVHDPWFEVPNYENQSDFLRHHQEKPCCEVFQSVKQSPHLNCYGYAAATDTLVYY